MSPRPSRPWFRFYVEALADRKLRRLTPTQRWIWVAVLAVARQSPTPGVLLVGENQPMDCADLSDIAAVTPRDVRRALALFEEAGMIQRAEADAWVVSKWTERQYETDVSTARVALHRDSEKRERIKDRDAGLCRYCGQEVQWTDRRGSLGGTYDHVDPSSGDQSDENLVVACRACNGKKGSRTPEQAGMRLLDPGTHLGSVSKSDLVPTETESETEAKTDRSEKHRGLLTDVGSVSNPERGSPAQGVSEQKAQATDLVSHLARRKAMP